MTRKELIMNDGYWEAKIDCLLDQRNKNSVVRKGILKLKNELIDVLTNN